ncbi:unnamed protein product, partial [Allacma fusca]
MGNPTFWIAMEKETG